MPCLAAFWKASSPGSCSACSELPSLREFGASGIQVGGGEKMMSDAFFIALLLPKFCPAFSRTISSRAWMFWPEFSSTERALEMVVSVRTCMHACMHACIHPYRHTHTYIHTSIQPYIHTPIHPYIHTPIHPYIRTSVHPYIHTSILHT